MSFLFKGEKEGLMVQIAKKWQYLDDLWDISEKEGRELLLELGRSWPSMPLFSPSKKLILPQFISKISWDTPPPFMIFFPGSFNPWHQGHRFCVEFCQKRLPDAHLMVVPDHNPWKNTLRYNPWQDFLNICKDVRDLPCSVYPGFWGLEKENYTVDWLPLVKIEKKGLLMGGDNLLLLLKWKKIDQLLHSIQVIVAVCRKEDFHLVSPMKNQLEKDYGHLNIILIKDNPFADLSSSKLRNC